MNRTVAAATAVLVVMVGIFAYLNMADRGDRLAAQREAKLYIEMHGERIATADFETVSGLPEHEFEATMRSSEGAVRDSVYTGVRLRDLLEYYDLPTDEVQQVITQAVDGYTVALNIDEVMQEDNVYIAYKIDGEPMASREDGGVGPYQLIIREDEFGQRWNKYLMEIKLD